MVFGFHLNLLLGLNLAGTSLYSRFARPRFRIGVAEIALLEGSNMHLSSRATRTGGNSLTLSIGSG